MITTLPETNIGPEIDWLEDEIPFRSRPIFTGVCCWFHGGYPVEKLVVLDSGHPI